MRRHTALLRGTSSLVLPRVTATDIHDILRGRRSCEAQSRDRRRILLSLLLIDVRVDCQNAFSSRHIRDGCRVMCCRGQCCQPPLLAVSVSTAFRPSFPSTFVSISRRSLDRVSSIEDAKCNVRSIAQHTQPKLYDAKTLGSDPSNCAFCTFPLSFALPLSLSLFRFILTCVCFISIPSLRQITLFAVRRYLTNEAIYILLFRLFKKLFINSTF